MKTKRELEYELEERARYERAVQHIMFSGSAAPQVFPLDMYWSGEYGTINDLITVAGLQAACTERFVGVGTWTAQAEALARMTVQASQGTLPTACRVTTTNIAKTGWTRGCSTPQKYDNNSVWYEFATSTSGPARVSASCWFRCTLSVDNNKDVFQLTKTGGGYIIANIANVGGGIGKVRCHGDGGGGYGSDINFTENTWYFLTLLALRSGTSRLRVYTASGVLVGESTYSSANNSGWRYIKIGRSDGTGDLTPPNDGGEIQISNVLIDYSHGIYPLGIEYDASNYPAIPVLSYSDSFNRADGALGSNWTEQVSGFAIASNMAVSSVAASPFAMAYYNGSFNQAQWSEAVIGDASGGGMLCGVGVRCTGTGASADGITYAARVGVSRNIQLVTGGVAANLDAVSFNSWALGDTVRIMVDGSFIGLFRKPSGSSTYTLIGKAYLNGTHATGNPGIYGGRTSGSGTTCKLDSWAGGNWID